MKKILFPLAVALVVLNSCGNFDSPDKVSTSDGNTDNTRVPIELMTSNPLAVVSTRGVGSVGDFEKDPKNSWNQEKLLISMFKKDDVDFGYAIKDYDDGDAEVMKDMIAYASASVGKPDLYYVSMTSFKYYPARGTYTFFGYCIDDAINIPTGGTKADAYHLNDDKTERSVDVKIDGSQDIMVAATSSPESLPAGFTENMLYNSYTASNGIYPKLVFKHMLTRLRFIVKAGNEAAASSIYGVKVKAIQVKSKTTGKLVYAYNKEDGTFRLDFADVEKYLALKERSEANVMRTLTLTALRWGANGVAVEDPIGESLLVAPAKAYDIKLIVVQRLRNDATSTECSIDFPTLKLPNEANSFQAGSSYDVRIEIFGRKKSFLPEWSDGGTSNISTGDSTE